MNIRRFFETHARTWVMLCAILESGSLAQNPVSIGTLQYGSRFVGIVECFFFTKLHIFSREEPDNKWRIIRTKGLRRSLTALPKRILRSPLAFARCFV